MMVEITAIGSAGLRKRGHAPLSTAGGARERCGLPATLGRDLTRARANPLIFASTRGNIPRTGVCVMKLWMRERDQLIETTLAFVEGVSGARLRSPVAAPIRTEPPKAEPVRPTEPIAIMLPVSPASERAEIERRVAKFKAQQQKFQREREASYTEIFSKTRATRGNAARA
jgi:hypothetical protein